MGFFSKIGKFLKRNLSTIGAIGGGLALGPWGAALGAALGKTAQKGSKVQFGDVLGAGIKGGAGAALFGGLGARLTGGQGPWGKAFSRIGGVKLPAAAAGAAAAPSVAAPSMTAAFSNVPMAVPAATGGASAAAAAPAAAGGWGSALKGAWKGLSGLEKAQVVSSGIQAGTGAYGAYEAGKMADKQFRLEQEERRRRLEREEAIRQALQGAYSNYQSGWRKY